MKKILSILLLLFINHICFAQNTTQKMPDTSKLRKFEGVWAAKINGKTFALHLQLEQVKHELMDINLIQGYYTYGDESVQSVKLDGKLKRTIVNGFFYDNPEGFDEDKLAFILNDTIKKKNGRGLLVLSPSNSNKVIYKLENMPGVRIGKFDRTFSVPTHLTLTKVK